MQVLPHLKLRPDSFIVLTPPFGVEGELHRLRSAAGECGNLSGRTRVEGILGGIWVVPGVKARAVPGVFEGVVHEVGAVLSSRTSR